MVLCLSRNVYAFQLPDLKFYHCVTGFFVSQSLSTGAGTRYGLEQHNIMRRAPELAAHSSRLRKHLSYRSLYNSGSALALLG